VRRLAANSCVGSVVLSKKQIAVMTVVGLLVGAVLGSYDRLPRPGMTQEPQREPGGGETSFPGTARTADAQDEGAGDVKPLEDVHTNIGSASVASSASNDEIFLSGNVTMAPRRENGVFVGYEIVSAGSDGRFSRGDVITSINGIPVEDSAAGGELAVAALANRNAEIELRNQ